MVRVLDNVNLAKPVDGVPVAAKAYVLYEANGAVCAATRHTVVNNQLGLGRIITLQRLRSEVRDAAETSLCEFLTPNTLVHSEQRLVWHSKAVKAPMWFQLQGKTRGFEVWWPNLLWDVDRVQRRLNVYALGSGRRPTLSSKVYHAPLMNIDRCGLLCEGSAHLPRQLDLSNIKKIEACIFESAFTHTNHDHTLRGGASNSQHVKFWREMSKSKDKVRVKDMTALGNLKEILS